MMNADDKAAWLAARAGKLTASRMADAMSFKKDGTPTAARCNYMRDLVAERVTGYSTRHFVTPAMEHGIEYEDEAADYYVAVTGKTIRHSRFYEHPTLLNFGATPDREINTDGLIQIKCPTTSTFLEWVLAGVVPEECKPQMCAELLCTGKKWCGFLAYDPRIKDERKRMFTRKYEPTPEELHKVFSSAVQFLDELDSMFTQFVEAA